MRERRAWLAVAVVAAASSPGALAKPRGTADGVAPGAKDVRIELKPR
jgi:hypothetical protein